MIDPKLWSDQWIRKLNPLDRYLFIYLLTNERSSWCGVYELDLGVMAFECGIDERDLEKSMLPRLSPKVLYVDGWVCFKNWEKYHNNGSADTKKGIENAWEAVPEKIRLKIRKLSASSRPPIDPPQGTPSSTSTSTSTSTSKATAKPVAVKQPKYTTIGAEVIKAFELVDSKNKTYYSNTTQRAACDFLIAEHGLEKVLEVVSVLPQINQMKLYLAQITTPHELKENWVKLVNKMKSKENEKNEKLNNVVW